MDKTFALAEKREAQLKVIAALVTQGRDQEALTAMRIYMGMASK